MPDDYEPRDFCCRTCGWILGESYREDGKRITQLRTFRHAKDGAGTVADLSTVPVHIKFGMLKVNDGGVLCDHCGDETPWFANATAIVEMLERKKARRKLELIKPLEKEIEHANA